MAELLLKELSRYRIGTFADIIYRNALLYPEREAFISGSKRVTFAEYNARVNSLIHALWSMGNSKGDVIGILSTNCLEYFDVFGAALKGGFIVSPINVKLQTDEIEYLVNYSEADALFVAPESIEIANLLRARMPKVKNFISFGISVPNMICHNHLLNNYSQEEPDVQVDEDDSAYVFFTGGTSGTPKGALYTQCTAMDDIKTIIVELSLGPSDKLVLVMPQYHIGGFDIPMAYFYVGGSTVIVDISKSFNPETTLRTIENEKATGITVVPTHLISMLSLPDLDTYNISSLRRVFYVASPMPSEVLKKCLERWGPIFVQAYGQTESGPNSVFLKSEDHNVLFKSPEEQNVLSSAGRAAVGVHVRIIDEGGNDCKPGDVGEIIIQSKHLMVGYWRKPEETAKTIANGWLHTGDMGYYDDKGYIYIVDRKKDKIISGGENIYPREVEEVLYQHPSVLEAAVIGVPDPYWVERVHAVVALKEGHGLSADELIGFCKKRITRHKVPKSVEFVESLPKTSTGKILKRELRYKYGKNPEKGI